MSLCGYIRNRFLQATARLCDKDSVCTCSVAVAK